MVADPGVGVVLVGAERGRRDAHALARESVVNVERVLLLPAPVVRRGDFGTELLTME